MKNLKVSLVACILLSTVTTINAESLNESLKNGKVSGDIATQYESRNQDKEVSSYYSDTAYAVGSIGLNYKTASYNNFYGDMGVRTYSFLFEDDKDFDTGYGKGDANERFRNGDGRVALSKLYLGYINNLLSFKVGRQNISTEWIDKLNDGMDIVINPSENTSLHLVYSEKRGRVREIDYRPSKEINNGNGVYAVEIIHKLDNVSLMPYYVDAPNNFSVYGAKVKYDRDTFGGLIHTMIAPQDDSSQKEGKLFESKVYTKFSGYTVTLGYTQTGKENGLGKAHSFGDDFVPFEEGDQMYVKDSSTVYSQLEKNFMGVDLTALYGITEYGNFKNSELNIWAGYKIYENLKLKLCYTYVNEDSKDTSRTNLEQLSSTLVYKF